MFTHKFFSLFYFRPNMVFFGHFAPSRSANAYIHTDKDAIDEFRIWVDDTVAWLELNTLHGGITSHLCPVLSEVVISHKPNTNTKPNTTFDNDHCQRQWSPTHRPIRDLPPIYHPSSCLSASVLWGGWCSIPVRLACRTTMVDRQIRAWHRAHNSLSLRNIGRPEQTLQLRKYKFCLNFTLHSYPTGSCAHNYSK